MATELQRVAPSETLRTVRTSADGGISRERPAGNLVEAHCTVPYIATYPDKEMIVHVFGDGRFLTEADVASDWQYFLYSGGVGRSDPLVRGDVVGVWPIMSGFRFWIQMDDDYTAILSMPFASFPTPPTVRTAVLNATNPEAVVQSSPVTLLTLPAALVSQPIGAVALSSTKLLMWQVQYPDSSQIKAWVITRTGNSLSIGAENLLQAEYIDVASSEVRGMRINATTAYWAVVDLGESRSHSGDTEDRVKGFTLNVSGDTVSLGSLHSMYWSLTGAAGVQTTPLTSGPVVIGCTTAEHLPGNWRAQGVWAVNPLTGQFGPEVIMDVEITEQGFMQPTGPRQAATVVTGVVPANWDPPASGDDQVLGMVVNVKNNLTVDAHWNAITEAVPNSELNWLNAGWGLNVYADMWMDRSRSRGRLLADYPYGASSIGGISHYIVTGGRVNGPSTTGPLFQRLHRRNG